METLFDNASRRIKSALGHIDIHEDTPRRLALPKATLKVSLPVQLDDGELHILPATRYAMMTRAGRPKSQVQKLL